MKKTMFITSVIMVVVLAIALTTSSLAWFTAGGTQTVNVSTMTITSATAEAAGAGLEINHTVDASGTWYTSTPVALNAETRTNNLPGALVFNKAATQMTADELYQAMSSIKGNKSYQKDGVETFNGTAYSVTPYSDFVWIHNTGYTACNINCSINNIQTAAAQDPANGNHDAVVWIAVFDVTDWDATNKTGAVLMALSQSGSLTKMAFTTSEANLATDKAVSFVEGIEIANLPAVATTSLEAASNQMNDSNPPVEVSVPGKNHKIAVYAWFDGVSLTNHNMNTVVTFDLSFTIQQQQNP